MSEFSAGSHCLYRSPSWPVLSWLSPMSTAEGWCVPGLSLTSCRVLEKEKPTAESLTAFPTMGSAWPLQSEPPSSDLHSPCLRQREHLGLREASGPSLTGSREGAWKTTSPGWQDRDRQTSRSRPEMPWQRCRSEDPSQDRPRRGDNRLGQVKGLCVGGEAVRTHCPWLSILSLIDALGAWGGAWNLRWPGMG